MKDPRRVETVAEDLFFSRGASFSHVDLTDRPIGIDARLPRNLRHESCQYSIIGGDRKGDRYVTF